MSGTRTSLAGWLARMGFTDVPRAARELAALGIAADGHPVLTALAQAADPGLALAGLARIAERESGLTEQLTSDAAFSARLTAVLGVSKALADHLARHPEDTIVLRGQDADRRQDQAAIRAGLLTAVAADPGSSEPRADLDAGKTDPAARLAAAYRRHVLHLAARDLTGKASVDEVGQELAVLADAVLEAALAIARAELPADAAPARLAIIAMGKCGARELNYASDVDVIFVAEPAPEPAPDGAATAPTGRQRATRLAAGMIQVCERSTPEGSILPRRPEPAPRRPPGPARPHAGQPPGVLRPVGQDLGVPGAAQGPRRPPATWTWASATSPRSARWSGRPPQRENFVEDVQAMRRRVEATLPRTMAGRELKLGPGGLRDIEFAVQLLQLVHGRADERLRAPATLPALEALADGGYVGRADADDLADAYRFLRRTEHLLQLHRLRRTHTLPTDPEVLGDSLGR